MATIRGWLLLEGGVYIGETEKRAGSMKTNTLCNVSF